MTKKVDGFNDRGFITLVTSNDKVEESNKSELKPFKSVTVWLDVSTEHEALLLI